MRSDLQLDPADIRILRILQRDASLPIAEVAREAGMSQSPAWRRIKRLKDAGAIRAVVALVDREAVGPEFRRLRLRQARAAEPAEHGQLRPPGEAVAGGAAFASGSPGPSIT
jgi:DNA-binding Lrp family transcriptional regulator